MARPRSFEREAALEQAMRLFWARGYAGVSIQDVVEATGLSRASLYAAFGDKRALFREAVEHYVARVSAGRLARLDAPGSAKAAIRRYFDDLAAFTLGEGRKLGCLLTNTAVELAPHDAAIEARLKASFAKVEAAFARTIRRGQAQGEIAAQKDPRALARFLVNAVQGLRVFGRARPSRAALHDIVSATLAALD
jgi:TetR/AcrR family transcriptional regulator, transcriptional repressor for nem operon